MIFTASGTFTFKPAAPARVVAVTGNGYETAIEVLVDPAVEAEPCVLVRAEKYLVQLGHKIKAIQCVRERTALNLAESKQLCDDYQDQLAGQKARVLDENAARVRLDAERAQSDRDRECGF